MLPPLRGYQREAVEAIVEGATRDGRGQVIAACGTGKTLIAAHAAVRCCPQGLVVIVCPSLALVGQTPDERGTRPGRRPVTRVTSSRAT
ncbi:DEAD/DEAH box helicase family protein [Micromonospora rifamycinica]|uniref:DEAD/DEAH box helicase family protein n=1 Tax=Micromonospora rifamycinica TaxID=291594 RepID=UPI0039A78509